VEKILADMKLTYLAIELCALIPWEENEHGFMGLCQKCLNLKALDVHKTNSCTDCKNLLVEMEISL